MSFPVNFFFEEAKKILKYNALPQETYLLAANQTKDDIVYFNPNKTGRINNAVYDWRDLYVEDDSLTINSGENVIDITSLADTLEHIRYMFYNEKRAEYRILPLTKDFMLSEINNRMSRNYSYSLDIEKNKIYINPRPGENWTIIIGYKKRLDDFTSINDTVNLSVKFKNAFKMGILEYCAPYSNSKISNQYYALEKQKRLLALMGSETGSPDYDPGQNNQYNLDYMQYLINDHSSNPTFYIDNEW